MDIDVWEVAQATATKPFGFMPFYPGPGIGGHCIPLDPMYLAWKAKVYGFQNKFIELAGDVNANMPRHVMAKIGEVLNLEGKAIQGAQLDYHDRYVDEVTEGELEYASLPLSPETLNQRDCVVLATEHDRFDYDHITQHSRLIVDTRNAFAGYQAPLHLASRGTYTFLGAMASGPWGLPGYCSSRRGRGEGRVGPRLAVSAFKVFHTCSI